MYGIENESSSLAKQKNSLNIQTMSILIMTTTDLLGARRICGQYGMRISDMDLWIDPTSTGCPAKYMNHLCEPNFNLEQWAVDGLPRMCFFAMKDIKSGEELTFDYNWKLKAVSKDMFVKSATKCKCGKPRCRTYIERMMMQGMRQRGQGLRECGSL